MSNVAAHETPGVYYERVDARSAAITAIRTDIAGLVGLAPRGPVDSALPVESFRQFQAHFGDFTGAGFLAYAVRGFFENGGRRCWIVRVASNDTNGGYAAAEAVFSSPVTVNPIWRIRASSPGVWGNNLTATLIETHRAQTLSIPTVSKPEAAKVESTSGFQRGTLVRLTQPATPPLFRVVSRVDPIEQLLVWLHEKPEERLPYDNAVSGFDPDQPIFIESVEYSLLVRQSDVPVLLRERLSLIPEHDDYGLRRLPPLVNPADLESLRVLPPVPAAVEIDELRPQFQRRPGFVPPQDPPLENLDLSRATLRLTGGADGLSLLTTYDFVGEPASPSDSDTVKAFKQRGIQNLARIEEVAIVAVPDIHIQPVLLPPRAPLPPCIPDVCLPVEIPPAEPFRDDLSTELPPKFRDDEIFRVQASLIQMCETLQDRIAVLDPPFSAARNDQAGPAAIRAWRSRFDSKYAALYYPWLRVVDPLRRTTAVTRDIPPSGHVIGQYARSDLETGVHKAPANAPLSWNQDVTVPVSDAIHGLLNTLGVNVLRVLPGRGTRIMGARTVSSDPDWNFVNVRRLIMMIEEAIQLSIQWAVFEPNDTITRAKISLSISSFLLALWQQGALAGETADEAFFVRCDETNNPPSERDNGRLVALVGVAPSYPFEFVVVRVGRIGNEFEIQETQIAGER